MTKDNDRAGAGSPSPGKRILYVESSAAAKAKDPYDLSILNGVRERYEVVRYFYLDQKAANLLHGSGDQAAFDALITHLPMGGRHGDSYEYGLNLLFQIRSEFEKPIIIYTGAVFLARQVAWDFADEVVSKEADPEQNLKFILTALENGWKRLAENKPVMPPQLFFNEGWTVVEFDMRLVMGLLINTSHLIYKLCRPFPGKVLLEKMNDGRVESAASGTDMMEMLAMCSCSGTPMRVSVEGAGEDAQLLAKRIYSIMVSLYPCQTDVDRFV
jgi:phosphotransferase system HPr-like phosphotransfer protein